MENNKANPITGNKGVFPGEIKHNNQVTPPTSPTPPIISKEVNELVENNNDNLSNLEKENFTTNTYLELNTKNIDGEISGIIEIDLISFRERGQESRYLSINTKGVDKEGAQGDVTISIDNEDDFNVLKKFISELNWND